MQAKQTQVHMRFRCPMRQWAHAFFLAFNQASLQLIFEGR